MPYVDYLNHIVALFMALSYGLNNSKGFEKMCIT